MMWDRRRQTPVPRNGYLTKLTRGKLTATRNARRGLAECRQVSRHHVVYTCTPGRMEIGTVSTECCQANVKNHCPVALSSNRIQSIYCVVTCCKSGGRQIYEYARGIHKTNRKFLLRNLNCSLCAQLQFAHEQTKAINETDSL